MKLSKFFKITNTKDIAIDYGLPSIPEHMVYLLTFSNEIVYVGKAENYNLLGRYNYHRVYEKKKFDNFIAIPVDSRKTAYDVEQGLIAIVNPEYNKKTPKDKNYYIKITCDYFNMNADEYMICSEKISTKEIQRKVEILAPIVLSERLDMGSNFFYKIIKGKKRNQNHISDTLKDEIKEVFRAMQEEREVLMENILKHINVD